MYTKLYTFLGLLGTCSRKRYGYGIFLAWLIEVAAFAGAFLLLVMEPQSLEFYKDANMVLVGVWTLAYVWSFGLMLQRLRALQLTPVWALLSFVLPIVFKVGLLFVTPKPTLQKFS